jgi:hypothetical protein
MQPFPRTFRCVVMIPGIPIPEIYTRFVVVQGKRILPPLLDVLSIA